MSLENGIIRSLSHVKQHVVKSKGFRKLRLTSSPAITVNIW